MALSKAFLFSVLPLVAYATDASNRCIRCIVPISVTTSAISLNLKPFANSIESTQHLVDSTSQTNYSSSIIGSDKLINKTYDIAIEYCPAKGQPEKDIIQVLTHGAGFDRSYWDFGGAEYNYIKAANAAGYPTLSYDRLGAGQSEHADPYLDVQARTELVVLSEITSLLRVGRLSSRIPIPSKVVHVGHSFGSLLSNGLAASKPGLSDGLVLTGFTHNSTYQPLFSSCLGFQLARENNPNRFGNYSSGYLTWGDKYDNQCAFMSYPYFAADVLELSEKTKTPVAVAEFALFGSIDLVAPEFKKPVLMITGDMDRPFCGGNCYGIVDSPFEQIFFPNASVFKAVIHPKTGHGLNLHYNATGAYSVINKFLDENVA